MYRVIPEHQNNSFQEDPDFYSIESLQAELFGENPNDSIPDNYTIESLNEHFDKQDKARMQQQKATKKQPISKDVDKDGIPGFYTIESLEQELFGCNDCD
jgi:formate-dependent nitrite reductase cytochrome c552 subunit